MYAGKAVEKRRTWTRSTPTRGCRIRSACWARCRGWTVPAERLTPIEGSPPNVARLPGCPFVPRCPVGISVCETIEPALEPTAGGGRHRRLPPQRGDRARADPRGTPVFPPPAIASVREQVPREPRTAVLEVRDLGQALPLITKGVVLRRGSGPSPPSTASASTSARARRSAWSGSPAAARRRRSCRSSRLQPPSREPSRCWAPTSPRWTATAAALASRDLQVVFQDPLASLDPRLPVGDIIDEPLRAFGVDAETRRDRVRELLSLVGLSPSTPTGIRRTSRAVNGSGSASRGRWRWNRSCWCSTSRCRRSTSPSRPVCSTCWRTSRSGWASPTCSSPTTCRSCARRRPGGRHVPGPARGRSARPTTSSTGRPTRTRRRCCPRSPSPTRWPSGNGPDPGPR